VLRILTVSSEIVPVEHNFLDSVLAILQSSKKYLDFHIMVQLLGNLRSDTLKLNVETGRYQNVARANRIGPHSVSIWLVRCNSFYFSYYSKYMNLLHNHFMQIYVLFLYTYGKTNESGDSVF
jgi:hypothetical protein